MTEPINVTPGKDQGQPPTQPTPPPAPESFPRSSFGADHDGGTPPEWLAWAWSSDRNRSFPWLGLLLVMVGAVLLINYFLPAVGIGTLILLALAVVFFAGWIFGGSRFVLVPGLIVLALAVARLVDELNIYTGPGTTPLALAAAFVVMWLIFAARGRRATWPLWGVAIFGLIGLVEVSSHLAKIPDFGGLWPALIIVIGLILVMNSRRGQPRPRRRRR